MQGRGAGGKKGWGLVKGVVAGEKPRTLVASPQQRALRHGGSGPLQLNADAANEVPITAVACDSFSEEEDLPEAPAQGAAPVPAPPLHLEGAGSPQPRPAGGGGHGRFGNLASALAAAGPDVSPGRTRFKGAGGRGQLSGTYSDGDDVDTMLPVQDEIFEENLQLKESIKAMRLELERRTQCGPGGGGAGHATEEPVRCSMEPRLLARLALHPWPQLEELVAALDRHHLQTAEALSLCPLGELALVMPPAPRPPGDAAAELVGIARSLLRTSTVESLADGDHLTSALRDPLGVVSMQARAQFLAVPKHLPPRTLHGVGLPNGGLEAAGPLPSAAVVVDGAEAQLEAFAEALEGVWRARSGTVLDELSATLRAAADVPGCGAVPGNLSAELAALWSLHSLGRHGLHFSDSFNRWPLAYLILRCFVMSGLALDRAFLFSDVPNAFDDFAGEGAAEALEEYYGRAARCRGSLRARNVEDLQGEVGRCFRRYFDELRSGRGSGSWGWISSAAYVKWAGVLGALRESLPEHREVYAVVRAMPAAEVEALRVRRPGEALFLPAPTVAAFRAPAAADLEADPGSCALLVLEGFKEGLALGALALRPEEELVVLPPLAVLEVLKVEASESPVRVYCRYKKCLMSEDFAFGCLQDLDDACQVMAAATVDAFARHAEREGAAARLTGALEVSSPDDLLPACWARLQALELEARDARRRLEQLSRDPLRAEEYEQKIKQLKYAVSQSESKLDISERRYQLQLREQSDALLGAEGEVKRLKTRLEHQSARLTKGAVDQGEHLAELTTLTTQLQAARREKAFFDGRLRTVRRVKKAALGFFVGGFSLFLVSVLIGVAMFGRCH